MRDPARIKRIINKLRAYWLANPDLRLGQIVVNLNTLPQWVPASTGYVGECGGDPFYIEDDLLEEALDKRMKR